MAKVSSVVQSEKIAIDNECSKDSGEIYLVLIIWHVVYLLSANAI